MLFFNFKTEENDQLNDQTSKEKLRPNTYNRLKNFGNFLKQTFLEAPEGYDAKRVDFNDVINKEGFFDWVKDWNKNKKNFDWNKNKKSTVEDILKFLESLEQDPLEETIDTINNAINKFEPIEKRKDIEYTLEVKEAIDTVKKAVSKLEKLEKIHVQDPLDTLAVEHKKKHLTAKIDSLDTKIKRTGLERERWGIPSNNPEIL